MTIETLIPLCLYCAYAIYRDVKNNRERKAREVVDAFRDEQFKQLEKKVAAMEQAILDTPFIHYKPN